MDSRLGNIRAIGTIGSRYYGLRNIEAIGTIDTREHRSYRNYLYREPIHVWNII